MSTKIISEINPTKVYETKIPSRTKKDLQVYCKLNLISIEEYFYKSKLQKYILPGAMIVDIFRATIEKLHREDPEFPIKRAIEIGISHGAPLLENRFYAEDELIFRAIIKLLKKDSHHLSALCHVEILRHDSIVLSGLFDFIEDH